MTVWLAVTVLRRCRIKANTSVFQTDDKGSIPFTCSIFNSRILARADAKIISKTWKRNPSNWSLYGGIDIVVIIPLCDCGYISSILICHPNFQNFRPKPKKLIIHSISDRSEKDIQNWNVITSKHELKIWAIAHNRSKIIWEYNSVGKSIALLMRESWVRASLFLPKLGELTEW